MTDKFEKSELRTCLSGLGFKFKKNKRKLYARIPKNIDLSLSDQAMRVVVYVFAKNKDIPREATELQVNGFSISFQRFEENELILLDCRRMFSQEA